MALRAGAVKAWGGFALQDGALLGGDGTLRGYAWNRFIGDAGAYGSAELRVPVIRVAPFVRGDLGIIALADVGRVWYRGASPGGWHSSFGGGVSFASLGHAVSAIYAHGEISSFYAYFGFPF